MCARIYLRVFLFLVLFIKKQTYIDLNFFCLSIELFKSRNNRKSE